MQTNELMIGDWVEMNLSPSVHKSYFKAQIVVSNLVSLEANYEFDAKPIPLTAEILEKNGAEKEYEWSRYCISEPYGREIYAGLRMDGVYLYADEEDDKRNFFAHIKYVHELQHALRLCGLNKLADNFKI